MIYKTDVKTRAIRTILAFLCIAGVCGCSSQRTGGLSGEVKLENRDKQEGVQVVIPGTQYRAVTDSKGKFSITGLKNGDYEAVFTAEGFQEFRSPFKITTAKPLLLDAIELKEIKKNAGSIAGIVKMEPEQSSDGVLVTLIGTSFSTETDDKGFFRLEKIPAGSYQLLAIKDDWLPVTKDAVVVENKKETQVPEILMVAMPKISPSTPPLEIIGDYVIRGVAFLEGESVHRGIKVALEDYPAKATFTDSSGIFEVTGVDTQMHTLVLNYKGFNEQKIANALPGPVTSSNTVGFITLTKEVNSKGMGILQGHVYLSEQRSHANTIVRLLGISQSVITDTNGRYMFIGIPAGDYALTAEHTGYQTDRIPDLKVVAEQITPIQDITLRASTDTQKEGNGTIQGSVLLEGQSDHGGVAISIEGTSLITASSEDGTFVFDHVPAGDYSVVFSKGGYKNAYLKDINVKANQPSALEPVTMQKDVEPPFVVETFPREGSRKVPIAYFVDVIVRFSERMSGESVKRSVVINPPVDFTAFFDRESQFSDIDVLHLRLAQDGQMPVRFKTRYAVTITPDAVTPKGIPLAQPYTFTFTTDGPLILNSKPADGDTQVFMSQEQPLMIEANAPVDPKTVERAIRFRPKPDATPIFQYVHNGPGCRILIQTNLRPNTRYSLLLDNTLRTLDGQRYSNAPFNISFQTAGPDDRIRGGSAPRNIRGGRR